MASCHEGYARATRRPIATAPSPFWVENGVEKQKNEFVGNANFEVEKLDILRAEYSRRLKESLESEPVIEVAE